MTEPSGFRKRLDNSLELLRKSEHLAKMYDKDGFYLAFSGGKDSQALYHLAVMSGVQFKAHMNLTSIDPPEVIRFVKMRYKDVVLHKPKDSIFNMFVKKKFLLPSRIIRWCCAEIKEGGGSGTVCLTGIRKQESTRRSKRNPVEVSNRSFSGDLEGFEEWRKKVKNLNQDQFAETSETDVRCINGKDKIIINPIIEWTLQDVWYFLNEVVKVPHCELYDKGWHRIGCILCPMSPVRIKYKEMKAYPHVKRNWIKAIMRIRAEVIGDNMILNNDFGGCNEEETCENIFQWWISGKSYEQWYAETFRQMKIDF